MHHRLSSAILFLTVLAISPAMSQTAVQQWMLREILKDKPVGSEITSLEGPGPAIFVPPDLPEPSRFNTTRFENLIFDHKGLYFNIDGTDRVYEITANDKDGKSVFSRIDSSEATGYNFGAYLFNFNDTLYSLGGYGYWNYNSQLRYFNSRTHKWDLMPVNRRISVLRIFGNAWLDNQNGFLFYQSKDSILMEGLLHSRLPQQEHQGPILLFKLDLKNKQWSSLGKLTPQTTEITLQSNLLTNTPFGQLLIQDSKANYLACLIDAAHNRVWALKDKELSSELYHAVRAAHPSSGMERPLYYYHNSKLVILSPNSSRYEFHIDSSDLKVLPFVVYEPDDAVPIKAITDRTWLLAAAVALNAFILWMFWRNRSRRIQNQKINSSEPFDITEKRILQELCDKNGQALSTEQLDALMGTSDKSLDLRNKRRSTLIRSINSKFQKRSETVDPLINIIRMESDRRMIQYTLNKDYLKMCQSLID